MTTHKLRAKFLALIDRRRTLVERGEREKIATTDSEIRALEKELDAAKADEKRKRTK